MEPGGDRNALTQLRRGVLEYCVLSLLADEERYGFDLVRQLGSVDGLVSTSWAESDAGPPRRYYAITGQGRRALASFAEEWRRFRDSVDSLLTGGRR